jgi:hypothetical protein
MILNSKKEMKFTQVKYSFSSLSKKKRKNSFSSIDYYSLLDLSLPSWKFSISVPYNIIY